jgi:hypothetical protein
MITKIFCEIDDFMQEFKRKYYNNLLLDKKDKKKSIESSKLLMSEVMTILVYYHNYGNRTFKDFYLKVVCKYMKQYFKDLVSYNRFIELIPTVLIPITAFLQLKRLGKSNQITFVDSTRIKVCHNKRMRRNKTFKGIASIGKSTMGWFFGFKLHIAIDDTGELIGATLTKGNIDDRNESVLDSVLKNVSGKLYGDKGYISKKLFDHLFKKEIILVTALKKNMKNKLTSLMDKVLLHKRSVIETVNDQLKNLCNIEHTRSRSPINFMVNLVAGLIRYTYFTKKPSINFSEKDKNFLNSELNYNILMA